MNKEQAIMNIVRTILLESEQAEETASKVGKSYPALMREVNPHDKNAKLGVETLVEIMKITNDVRPLESLAELFGCTIKPISRDSCSQ